MMVKSTIASMSSSQLHTVMACGLATIDAGLIAVFDSIGVSQGLWDKFLSNKQYSPSDIYNIYAYVYVCTELLVI